MPLTELFRRGAEDGFKGLLDEELLESQEYLDGAAVGDDRYQRFIASRVDHGNLLVESIEEFVAMAKEQRGPECVSLNTVRKRQLLKEREGEGHSSGENHPWTFSDLFRLAEETGTGGCISFT